MITCPQCKSSFTNGTIVCPNDGADLEPIVMNKVEAPESEALVLNEPREPILEITVEDHELYGTFRFPLKMVGDPPLRIGRRDPTTSPPIHPEVDLTDWLQRDKGMTFEFPLGETRSRNAIALMSRPSLSRIQCVIERQDDKFVLRTMSDRVPTYHRRTGQPKARPLSQDEYVVLDDYDLIYLNNPQRNHLRLRIRFHS